MKAKTSFSPVNLQLTNNEDVFNEQGALINYFGLSKENRALKQNKRMLPKFSKKRRFEN